MFIPPPHILQNFLLISVLKRNTNTWMWTLEQNCKPPPPFFFCPRTYKTVISAKCNHWIISNSQRVSYQRVSVGKKYTIPITPYRCPALTFLGLNTEHPIPSGYLSLVYQEPIRPLRSSMAHMFWSPLGSCQGIKGFSGGVSSSLLYTYSLREFI